MAITVRNILREFTPSEVADITGVSTALQRDWRRREIISARVGEGWSRWDLTELIRVAILKHFADAGFSVQSAMDTAAMGILPTLGFMEEIDGATAVEAIGVEEETVARILSHGSVVGARGRYLVMANAGGKEPQIRRLQHLEQLPVVFDGTALCVILDCQKLAHVIAERAGGPLFRVECSIVEEDED